GKSLAVSLANAGASAVHFQVYSLAGSAVSMTGYDVTPRAAAGPVAVPVSGSYDVAVHGPNGFLTQFAGDAAGSGAGVEVTASIKHDGELRLTAVNGTKATAVNGTKADVRLNVRSLLHGNDAASAAAVKERTLWLAPGEPG